MHFVLAKLSILSTESDYVKRVPTLSGLLQPDSCQPKAKAITG
jgi:hypothetical protein